MDKKQLEKKIEEYLEVFTALRGKVNDERTAMGILQEASKDIRMTQIREERTNGNSGDNGEYPATKRQLKFLEKLGVDIPEKLTKTQASALIDVETGKESEQDSFQAAAVNIPVTWRSADW